MLGLGSNISKSPTSGATIVTDNLVLRHGYAVNPVQPLSDGAAAINADADGTDYIDVGLIPITTNDVTISAWVYVTSWVNYAGIFSNRHSSSPNQGFQLRTLSDKTFELITDESTSGSISSTSTAKNDNQWYHVCGVIDRDGNQYLYVDGILEDSDDISALADSLTHTTSARIGRRGVEQEFNGYACNVGYWNRVLDQDEIKSIMNKNYAGLSASEKTSLVSWWNLDSVIPNFTATTVYDNHGGEVVGSEEVANGDFALTSDWGSSQSISGGQLTKTGGGLAAQSGVITEGIPYVIVVDVASLDGATAVYVGGNSYALTVGVQTIYAIGGSSNDLLGFNNGYSTSTGSVINSISLKSINGNTGILS